MSYFTEDEKFILLSALSREKKFCDEHIVYPEDYSAIVKNLEHKLGHEEFVIEIRNKTIDEFLARSKEERATLFHIKRHGRYREGIAFAELDKLAKQMKKER